MHAKRVDDARWFALIGTVDRSHPFVITDGGTVVAPADGELVCYLNDVQDTARADASVRCIGLVALKYCPAR